MVRSVQSDNPRLSALAALQLVDEAIAAARANNLNPEFFCATLMQESAFDPNALSSAGAVGIAQFTLDTAASSDIDPFDPHDAIRGSAKLLGSYVRSYTGIYPDPYATALSAYNAGPGAVARYDGVPPYAQTRQYIADVYDRWAQVLRDEAPHPRQVRSARSENVEK
ncbi:MAG: lytic transglycosylase domain-containing protein [Candidatus Eremiobacteraeota bacterium]|nr:lytic transglycosylase domain-containing protein [Candidatus Eremiobacteraeota bacterium]